MMKGKWRWALYGAALRGVWSLSTYLFGLFPYYDWETANAEMMGIDHGQMFGGFVFGGVIGFFAGLVRDLFRKRAKAKIDHDDLKSHFS